MEDVIALTLEDARRRLAAAGVTVGTVTETRPPQPADLSGDLRVVRVRPAGDPGSPGHPSGTMVELVVTRERYVPPSR